MEEKKELIVLEARQTCVDRDALRESVALQRAFDLADELEAKDRLNAARTVAHSERPRPA
jgi:hypothetical protein